MAALRLIPQGPARALKRLDHAVGRLASARRILIDVRTAMNVAVLRPVWQRLGRDGRLTLRFTAEDTRGVQEELAAFGLGAALIPRESATWMRWDLAMVADAWNAAPLRRCLRRVKFFHGVAGKYDLDDPARLGPSDLERFDRVAFVNEDRMQRYLAAGAVRPDQAALVGFPKSDDLINGAWPAASVRASLGLPPDCPTVLYAPTFSTESSLHAAGTHIVAALLDLGVNVIVKLHDRSMTPHPKYTGGIDWPARLREFQPHSRFAFVRAGDAGPVLSAADVLVTDHSTVGFEFALLDRPIVVYDVPDLLREARIAADKWTLLRSMADVVDTPAAVADAVGNALAHPARLREARAGARRLFAHPGCATERALAIVYELLELEPLRAAPGTLPGPPPVRFAAGA